MTPLEPVRPAPPRGDFPGSEIHGDLTSLIGGTPIVRLNHLTRGLDATCLVKLESRNPGGSVKDRIALNMVLEAERRGDLKPGMTLVEPTSGNTGIALAWIAAVRGYKSLLVMPESMTQERRNLLQAYGAELVLTPAAQGMQGALEKAREIVRKRKDCFQPSQFENPANPDAHRKTTAEEIWRQTGGRLDAVVFGVGTGGTITGVGEVLKERNPDLVVAAVEPEGSSILSGGKPGWHDIQGLGAGFIPKVLNRSVYDEVITVTGEQAAETARGLARQEGILAGPASGANVFALLAMAKRPRHRGQTLLTVICDTGERYMSTPLFQQGA